MSTSAFLKNVWYYAIPSKTLPKKGMHSLEILGEPVVFFRDQHGLVKALRDICPHRGIPLSYGRVTEHQGEKVVECPYHGWKFNGDGVCTEIPSLCEGQDLDCRKIKVKHFPVLEQQGNIWIFYGDKDFDISKAPPIPNVGTFTSDKQPNFLEVTTFPCHLDHAVIGLMDPAHGPFVHQAWFWRSSKSIHEKKKKFAPVSHGFQMVQHQPSKNSRAYKFLGGAPTTEITFNLPSVRVEHVRVGTKSFVSYTALTPVNDKLTRIHQLAYWDLPWLTLMKPVIWQFTKVFLYQDKDAVSKQQDGLKYDPTLMLIKDADTQAKWYFSLKTEWDKSLQEQRQFQNPVKEAELRWRS
jgi:phenylpropionate dioxygenase-like ring-hydroxylating dioxygenase large terminal subunit